MRQQLYLEGWNCRVQLNALYAEHVPSTFRRHFSPGVLRKTEKIQIITRGNPRILKPYSGDLRFLGFPALWTVVREHLKVKQDAFFMNLCVTSPISHKQSMSVRLTRSTFMAMDGITCIQLLPAFGQ